MRIFSLKHTYHVVQRLIKNEDFEIFFCLEEEDERKNEYTVIRIWNQSLSYPVIPCFMDMMEQSSMDDFLECFSDEGAFCLIFRRYHEPLLFNKLAEEPLSLAERLVIGESLLKHIVLLNMPNFLLREVLRPENVVVANDLSVHFNYYVQSFSEDKAEDGPIIVKRLSEILQRLFLQEITDQSSKELTKFIQSLEEKKNVDYLELYRNFNELSQLLSQKDLAGEVKPKRIWFRIWDRMKKGLKYLKAVAYALVLVIVSLFLVYTLIHREPKNLDKTVFHYIGDINIGTED